MLFWHSLGTNKCWDGSDRTTAKATLVKGKLMDDALRDIIAGALNELDPQEDTQDDFIAGDEETVEEDADEFGLPLDDADDDIEADEAEESEEEESAETDEDTYKVKVDGETVEITLKEALAGYQRQADYTRKAQALAAERDQFQEEIQQYEGVLQNVQLLDEAWEENPISVIANFTMSTGNATQALALLIKELATQGQLDRGFMETFGITDDVRDEWSRESEVSQLKKKVSDNDKVQKSRLEEVEMEAAVKAAIIEFDQQIDEIIESEDLEMSAKDRIAFRKQLAAYARENELTNLKAAYKALKYEESKQKRALAEKTAAKAKEKKKTGAVARSGSAGSGTPVSTETDLRSIIMATMKENSAS
jgi:hypothetical protein